MSRGIEYKYIVAIVAVFGLFIDLLDATIVNVAIPTLAREFEAETTTIQWVVTGYLLSLAVFIPVSGWAGDRFGTRATFMTALAIFTASSAACAFAWNVESLILFRVIQGMGGGMLTPVGMTMVFRAFPPAERSRASGIMVIPTAVAPASGPVVGGWLVEYISWEWIFLINVPVGLAALFVCWRWLKEQKEEHPGKLDPVGVVLSASGLASLLYALAEAGTRGFDDGRVIAFGVAGLALLAAFVVVELRTEEPLIDVRLFGNRLFRSCNLTQVVAMTGFAGSLFLLPIFLQAERGLNAFESGLATFPMALGVMLAAAPTSRIYPHIGPRRLMIAGLLVSTVTSLYFVTMDLETGIWAIRGVMLVRGVGFGLMLIPLQAATFATMPLEDQGRASALFNAGRMVGQSLGVAIVATVLTDQLIANGAVLGNPATAGPAVDAFQATFLVATLLTLVGLVPAFLISDREAAPSMAPGAVAATTH